MGSRPAAGCHIGGRKDLKGRDDAGDQVKKDGRRQHGQGDIPELVHSAGAIDDRLIAEYSSHSRYIPTGEPYSNRYVSILDFAEGRITRWREYVNPQVVSKVLGENAGWSETGGARTA